MRKIVKCNIIKNFCRNWIHGFENHLGISSFPSLFCLYPKATKESDQQNLKSRTLMNFVSYPIVEIQQILTSVLTIVDLGISVHYRQPDVTLRLTERNPTVINCPEDHRVHSTRHRVMNKQRLPNSLFINLFNGLSNCLKLNLLCIQVPY